MTTLNSDGMNSHAILRGVWLGGVILNAQGLTEKLLANAISRDLIFSDEKLVEYLLQRQSDGYKTDS